MHAGSRVTTGAKVRVLKAPELAEVVEVGVAGDAVPIAQTILLAKLRKQSEETSQILRGGAWPPTGRGQPCALIGRIAGELLKINPGRTGDVGDGRGMWVGDVEGALIPVRTRQALAEYTEV
jgi:hypothetical protein